MTDRDDNPVTTGERYIRAAGSRNLRMAPGPCDAETLLAAAYATSNLCDDCEGTGKIRGMRCATCGGLGRVPNARKVFALKLYRAQVAHDMSDLAAIEIEVGSWLARKASRGSGPMRGSQRFEVVRQTLHWWLNQECGFCDALGYEVVEGTPNLSQIACAACFGTRKTPLKRVLPPAYLEAGAWLAKEMDQLCVMVLADMSAVLRKNMEFIPE